MKEKLLEKCFIGVDAGGTKTTIQAFTLNQQVITSIQLGVGSFANSLKEALHNIENGVRIVYNDVKRLPCQLYCNWRKWSWCLFRS